MQRGCVYVTNGYSRGMNMIPGLSRRGVLLNTVMIDDQDLILPRTAINGRKILYTAGTAFGNVQIIGEVLGGPVSNGYMGDDLSRVVNWFEQNRVGRTQSPVNVSVGSRGYKVYIHGLSMGENDPELNIHRFAIVGKTAKPPSR